MAGPGRRRLLLLPLAGIAACAPQPTPQPRYMVGAPYQLGGVWSYPREDFGLVQTGLASVAADTRAGRRTANGEVHDPQALTAGHRTLQLPAILRVTNLETGLEIEVRVNDRGPANPGRMVELSRRAAELIGLRPGGAAQVRIAVAPEASQALAAGLPNEEAPRLAVATAPLGPVQREDLAPPPGAAQAARVREARALPGVAASPAAAAPASGAPPARLPERVARVPAQPGRLYVEAATFGRRDLAQQQAARIGGGVEAIGPRGRQSFRVRIGPLASVAEADRALERTLRAGVSEARILVD
ncbi:sporulation and cell division repeat protein [Falsiroseomonas bella]|uniref:Endolytic peptidoglycan transglycosylase RlpA n=1 Tax=Falsiroseomonas bella TaxID=2184016 RepID=A0A317FAT8_9PROT|nr:SPOR domain-containing protein [Falsiroseomonas bella]PWS36184.1 sporulation and cell division repeat protein [Falsiroseomonas bella]